MSTVLIVSYNEKKVRISKDATFAFMSECSSKFEELSKIALEAGEPSYRSSVTCVSMRLKQLWPNANVNISRDWDTNFVFTVNVGSEEEAVEAILSFGS